MIASTISSMTASGIYLSVSDGALKYKARKGALTPAGREFLKKHRAEIIKHLDPCTRPIPSEERVIALCAHNALIYGYDSIRVRRNGTCTFEGARHKKGKKKHE